MHPRDSLSVALPLPRQQKPEEAGFREAANFPAVPVPASELFCHGSRMANIYEPGVERIHQKEMLIPGESVLLSIRKDRTLPYCQQVPLGWRGRLADRLEAALKGPRLDLKERLVYDARPVFNNNMAHLIQHHLSNLGYLKERLGHGPESVLVILEGRPAPLPVEVFSLLGYEVLKTNLAVEANLAVVSLGHFFHLLPWVRHLDLPASAGGYPAKVFIPRRASRRLINQAELESLLHSEGFETVYFEDIPIPQQWAVLRNANQVAAIHGAALGCLAFQAARTDRRKVRLLELFGPGFVVNSYRKYLAVLGGRWVGCRGKITPEVARDIDLPGRLKAHAFDDFELGVGAVEAGLEFLGSGDG